MAETASYITAEELLEAADRVVPTVDIDLGGKLMQLRLAGDYDEMLQLEARRDELVAMIRGKECPKELLRFRNRSDDAISTAGLLAFTAERPALTVEQALTLLKDGVTVKVVLGALQKAGVAHLIEAATKRIEEGKGGSGKSPDTE